MNANMNGHDYELLTTIGADFKQLCFVGTVARTHNKGLKEMAGDVVNQTFVLSTNFCGRLTVRASKPPLL